MVELKSDWKSNAATHRAELLDSTRWAGDFSWQEIAQMSAYMILRRYSAGAVICREGAHEPYLYVIVSGAVEVLKESSQHLHPRIATLGPGQTLGEMSLIDGEPRSATVVARSECVLLALSGDSFNRLLDESPKLGIRLLLKLGWLMSQRIRSTSGLLADALSAQTTVEQVPVAVRGSGVAVSA